MRINDTNFFDNWKEFSLQKPDEIILNHYDIVKNHTDNNGDVKHKNSKDVVKIFSLFITHNYGSLIYELCNFMTYLNQVNFSIYNVMVLNSYEVGKKIKKINFQSNQNLSNKVTLKIENHSFDILYSRISTYIVMIDFIEEFLGLEEILLIEDKINKLLSYRDLKSLSNNLSKKIYNYLKDLLPSSYLQRFSSAIGNRIVSKKEDDSYVIISSDISDDFILDFWLNSNSSENDLFIKTFSKIADLCFIYKKSIDLNNSYNSVVVDQINDQEPWNYLSKEDVDGFLDNLVDSSSNSISTSIMYLENLHEKKINILKKNEINEIKIFARYQKTSFDLYLTVLRICVFGTIQNKIVEAERRKKLNLDKDLILFSNEIKYKDQINIYTKLIQNNEFLKEIIFYRLWICDAIETFEYIKTYLDENELKHFNNFLNSQKEHLDIDNYFIKKNMFKKNSNSDEIFQKTAVNLLKNFKDFLVKEYQMKNFKKFNIYISSLKKKSKMFRRSGFDFNLDSKENIQMLIKSYNSLGEINKFLTKLLNQINSNVNSLDAQFNDDKIIFFRHFLKLYPNKEC